VAAALDEAILASAYGAEYIANLLEMRQRCREELSPLHLESKDEMLDIEIRQPDLNVYERK
jgi:hypothetical protein